VIGEVPASRLVFKWGRPDCFTAPVTNALNNFPNAHLNYPGTENLFFFSLLKNNSKKL
jgi:hypothetical protein